MNFKIRYVGFFMIPDILDSYPLILEYGRNGHSTDDSDILDTRQAHSGHGLTTEAQRNPESEF